MAKFAERTTVPASQSHNEIKQLVKKRGATSFGALDEQFRAIIAFEMNGRRIRFYLPLPKGTTPQQERQKWRALLLAIKSKLESVDSGIESFDDAFLAHVILPNGETFGDYAASNFSRIAKGAPIPALLEGPRP